MNKRQKKKLKKQNDLFIINWLSTYKELKEFDKDYYRYLLEVKQKSYLNRKKENTKNE